MFPLPTQSGAEITSSKKRVIKITNKCAHVGVKDDEDDAHAICVFNIRQMKVRNLEN